MAKRIVDRVTVTGADDSISPITLLYISERFPFAEFGILLSQKQEGTKRFPSRRWMMELNQVIGKEKLALSGHLCGHWVRDICLGGEEFFQEYQFQDRFTRLQLNFHAEEHPFRLPELERVLLKYSQRQFIFQLDGVNDQLFFWAREKLDPSKIVSLFDLSGGAGILPKKWPKANGYCGYAGGLSPDNLEEQMEKIAEVAGEGPIWIDAETLLRSNNDKWFDPRKVQCFLEAAEPWVIRS